MALAASSCNALLDLTTARRNCCRPLSGSARNSHRPLRFPCARASPSLQLKSARWVASAASSPSTTLAADQASLQALIHSKAAVLEASLHSPASPGGLENVVQALEETFRNSPKGDLAKRWQEYHGCSNWEGLLEPLDPDLRAEILKYGDLAQLTYDAFDNQEHSHTRGDCLYEEQELLHRAGLTWTGYTVTKYIYATSHVHVVPKWLEGHGMKGRESCWMGFVAVANDEKEIARLGRRDIVVVWRGTVTRLEWLENVDGAMIDPIHTIDERHVHPKCHFGVERGFHTLYTSTNIDAPHGHTSAAEQVRDEVKRLVDMYGTHGEESQLSITMTGHSLGGALALLAAYDVASTGVSKEVPVSVISFAAPRLGNEAFKRRLEELGVKVLRVVNTHDVVPKVPGIFIHESSSTSNVASSVDSHESSSTSNVASSVDSHGHDRMWNTYVHVGVALYLDNHHSPFLKKNANLVDSHNLDLYLHLVDGYRSAKVPFVGLHAKAHHLIDIIFNGQHDDHQLNTILFCMRYMKRDVALVNKTTNLLLDELHVAPNWQAKKLPKPSPRLSPSALTTSSIRITSYNVVPKLLHGLTRTHLAMP